ncbi:MAG TPA: hypothetical protein VMW81_08005 [Nitrospinota bacterium]|nr:hypothetical protein [Nitrospinota bacterium]
MKDKLIIAGVVIALVFTFLGYSRTKQLSGKVVALEQDVATLSKEIEELNKKILVSEKTMSFIENLTESLSKIIKGSEAKGEIKQ